MVTLALTMGDPAGIGPELCVRTPLLPEFDRVRFVVYGSARVLAEAARRFSGGVCPEVRETGDPGPFEHGKAAACCGKAAYDALTAPMNKYAVNLTGIPFSGHTERIAELCHTERFAMMQSSGSFRVAFVTTHIALEEVPRHVTKERIVEVGEMLRDVIRSEGIDAPLIGCAALNPHAGENGCMGKEDELVVKPAVAELNARSINVEGPLPPDVIFTERVRCRFDGIISMYHDQGHIPFKMLAFDTGVNSTLGLPVIRTSPDHGTAFDIAWQGKADLSSFAAACRSAKLRAEKRR